MNKITTEAVYEKIRAGETSPTKIGLSFGVNYAQASSRITPHIKKLVKDGRIIRFDNGKYSINPEPKESTQ